MQGKYSPTVNNWYQIDKDWFHKNGGGLGNGLNPESDDDNDGYDAYGYANGVEADRAGNKEESYYGNDNLYEDVAMNWSNKPLPYLKNK